MNLLMGKTFLYGNVQEKGCTVLRKENVEKPIFCLKRKNDKLPQPA